MRLRILFTVLLLIVPYAFADLGDFPDNIIKGNRLNAFIVVGSKSTAMDVVSQNMIGLALAGYIDAPQSGVNKLDSETNISQNLILIGNPCVNKLSAEILDNPSPCDQSYPAGKASIRYTEKSGVKYILVAGSTPQETKKAAEYLSANLDRLSGSEVNVNLADGKITATPETISANRTTASDVPSGRQINTSEKIPAGDLSEEKDNASDAIVVVKKKSIIQRFIDWLSSLFT